MQGEFHISPSSLNTFCECAYRYHLKYVERIPEGEDKRYFALGKLVHRTIAVLTEAVQADLHRRISAEALPDAVIEAAKLEGVSDSEIRRDALVMLTAWYDYDTLKTPVVLLDGEELRYEVEPGIPVIGKPDAIRRTETHDILVDYKTGNSRYYQSDVENSPQLLIYALLWKRHLEAHPERRPSHGNIPHMKIRYEQITHRKDVETEVDPNDLDVMEDWLKDVAHSMQSGDTTPNPGFYCRGCPYLSRCPSGTANVEEREQMKSHTAL
jgi:CRISPR/Cas system-associated exonuclease Cas4 (RecB family)